MFLLNRITRDQLGSFVFVGGGRNKVIGTISPPSLSTCRETKSVCCLTTETSTNVFYLPSWPDRPPPPLFFLTACKLSLHVSARRTLANHGAYLSNPAARRKAVYVKTSVRIRRQGRGSSLLSSPRRTCAPGLARHATGPRWAGAITCALRMCLDWEAKPPRDCNALSAGFLPARHGLHMGCQCESDSLSYAASPLQPRANFSTWPCQARFSLALFVCVFVCVCLSCSLSTHLSSLVEDHPPNPPKQLTLC